MSVEDDFIDEAIPISTTGSPSDWPSREKLRKILKALRDNSSNNLRWRKITADEVSLSKESNNTTLWIDRDCIITLDEYSSFGGSGFNCEVIIADPRIRVEVIVQNNDVIRFNESIIERDATIITTPDEGVFAIIGSVI